LFKKLKYILLFLIFFSTISYGLVAVSSKLPQFIKERSDFKVSFNRKPFDLQFDAGKYIIYINSKVIDNIKESTLEVFKSIGRDNPVKDIKEFDAE
jgi:hypothetical protein